MYWGFLEDVLCGMQFLIIFIAWIMECVTTTFFSLAINGGMYEHFKGERGLRQSDLISPYLFGICMEYLSQLLHQHTRGLDFHFHPKCEDLRITHLAYADDLLFFSKGDNSSVTIINIYLLRFGQMAKLRENLHISNIY